MNRNNWGVLIFFFLPFHTGRDSGSDDSREDEENYRAGHIVKKKKNLCVVCVMMMSTCEK